MKKTIKDKLSLKEVKMFENLLDMDDSTWENIGNPSITRLYNVAIKECFLFDKRNKAACSLRRCIIGLKNGFKRNTKAFDDLI